MAHARLVPAVCHRSARTETLLGLGVDLEGGEK